MKKTISVLGFLAMIAVAVSAFTAPAKAYGGVLSLSQNYLSLTAGSSAQVYVYPNNGQTTYLAAVINTNVMNATLSGNQITITGYADGNGQVQVCSYDGACGLVNVYVSSGSGYNYNYNYNNNYNYPYYSSPITLDATSINLNVGQGRNVYISGGSQPYYLGNTTGSNIATASIDGTRLYVYASNPGNTSISVCSSGYSSCATLYVYVSSAVNLSLSSTTLPDAFSGQYYSYQLSATGGSYPYRYYLYSGSLPPGLSLSTDGFINGYPQYAGTSTAYSFYLTIYDNYGQTAQSQFLSIRLYPGTNNQLSNNQQWNWYNQGSRVLGAYSYNNGALINDNGTIYITYKNQKSGFASAEAFLGLGYKWENVISGSVANLSPSGYTVTSNSVSHPWGSWIKSGQTVYFADPSGLIPVPSYDVFINNGGNLANIVDINYYDTRKTILPVMVLNDSRLK